MMDPLMMAGAMFGMPGAPAGLPMPMPQPPQPPSIQDIEDEAERLERTNARRNDIILSHRRTLWQLDRAQHRISRAIKGGDDFWETFVLKLSIPQTIRNKALAQLGEGIPSIRVARQGASDGNIRARELESWARSYRSQQDEQHRNRGGSNSFDMARADYLLGDGRVYQCNLPDKDMEDLPIQSHIWDTIECYPCYSTKGLERFIRKCKMSSEDIWRLYGTEYKSDAEPGEMFDCIIWLDRFYMAVTCDGEWLMEPTFHSLGRCGDCQMLGNEWCPDCPGQVPIVATHVNGRNGLVVENDGNTDEVEAYRGTGMLWHVQSELEALAKLLTSSLRATWLSTDPPILIRRGDSKEPVDVSMVPGTVIDADKDDAVDLLELKNALPQLEIVINRLMANIQAATVSVGPERTFASGIDRTQAVQLEQVFFVPYTSGLASHIERDVQMGLSVFRTWGPQTSVLDKAETGEEMMVGIDPFAIPEKVRVRVEFKQLRTMDKIQMLSLGVNLAAAGVVAPEDLYRMIGEEDPKGLADRALNWQMQRNPDVLQARAHIQTYQDLLADFLAGQQRGEDPLLLQLRQAALANAYQQALAAFSPTPGVPPGMPSGVPGGPPMPTGPGGAPSGPPSGPMLGGAPLVPPMPQQAGSNVPPGVLPPEAMGLPQTNEPMQQMLAALRP